METATIQIADVAALGRAIGESAANAWLATLADNGPRDPLDGAADAVLVAALAWSEFAAQRPRDPGSPTELLLDAVKHYRQLRRQDEEDAN